MTDIGEWAEARRLKIEQQLIELMTMIESNNAGAFARRTPLSIAQLNSGVRGRRVLVHAVVHNRVEMARALLTEGANANLSDSRGLPLMVAVTRDPVDIDMIRLLLRHGADAAVVVTRTSSSSDAALPLAQLLRSQSSEHLDVVQLLVDHGRAHAWWPTHVQWTPTSDSHYPIVAALERNRTETLHFLLARRSAAIHCEDVYLITRVLVNHNLSLLKTFLDAGVSPNVVPAHFITPEPPIFTILRIPFDATAFRMLIDAGADVNAMCRLGRTPLHVVIYDRLPLWIFDALLRRGAKIDAWNPILGGSPLTVACLVGSVPMAVFATTRGASPDLAVAPDPNLRLGRLHNNNNNNRLVFSREAKLLLAALGATGPLVDVHDIDAADYLHMLKAVEMERFRINRPRVLQICAALHERQLPALVLHEIVFFACGEVPMHLYWSAITCVKHFRDRKSGQSGSAAPAVKVERRRVRRQPS